MYAEYRVFPKIGGKTSKMDGENNGKPYCLLDDLGGKPTIFGNIHIGYETLPSYIDNQSHEVRLPEPEPVSTHKAMHGHGIYLFTFLDFYGTLDNIP